MVKKKGVIIYCALCGVECKGKLLVQLSVRGPPKVFCHSCFNKTLGEPIPKIRKLMKGKVLNTKGA